MEEFVYIDKEDIVEKNDVGIIMDKDNDIITVRFIRLDKKLKINKNNLFTINLQKVGDEYERKICDRCFKCLKIENFQNNRLKKDNKMTKRPSCKKCRSIIEGKRINSRIKKDWEEKRPHNDLFECPICKKVTIAGISKIVIDHNHQNGNVRGFICESCNTGLGRFKDSVTILENAIEWLRSKS